jgi:muramoyltetrapeptide carboxypeptidase LdcA involved in peptidoglycan recycling
VKFHVGGETWNKWNKMFSPELVRKQNVIAKEASGYTDHKGQPRSIGYWDQYAGHGANEGEIFGTTLCTLQLEVYYRYLPTFKGDDIDAEPVGGVNAPQEEEANNDVKIDISI